MKNPFKKKSDEDFRVTTPKRLRQSTVGLQQVRQEQAAAYDPTDPVWIAKNKRRADKLRNTPEAKALREKLK